MFKKILVPLDGSRFSSHALRYAIDIIKHYKARLILVRAIEPAVPISTAASSIGIESPSSVRAAMEAAETQDRLNNRRAGQYMRKKLHEVTSQGIDANCHVVTGDPYESIKKEKVDLVVMTTHGKSGFKRAILGSVADKVVRDSRVPVLVIRPKSRKRR